MSFRDYVKSKLKYPMIRVGLEVTALPAIHRLMPEAAGRGVIWTLHHVWQRQGKLFDPNAYLSVSPDFLATAIEESLAFGLTPVHLHDLPALLADPGDMRRFVAFTLDDGYRNNREFAAPVFRRFGVPYTIFVTTGFAERTNSMWWATAEALIERSDDFRFDFGSGETVVRTGSTGEKNAAFDRIAVFVRTWPEHEAIARLDAVARSKGIEPLAIVERLAMSAEELRAFAAEDPLLHLGAHTMTHPNLARLDDDRLRYEVETSVETVAAYAGQRPKSFSYPYGWNEAFSPRTEAAVAATGIGIAVTTRPGMLGPERVTHPFSVPRVSLNGYYQRRRYVRALLSGIPFKLMR